MTHAGNVFCHWVTAKNSTQGKRAVNSSINRGEATQGKPGVASVACAAEPCSGENPAQLTYTVSGNIAFRLKTI